MHKHEYFDFPGTCRQGTTLNQYNTNEIRMSRKYKIRCQFWMITKGLVTGIGWATLSCTRYWWPASHQWNDHQRTRNWHRLGHIVLYQILMSCISGADCFDKTDNKNWKVVGFTYFLWITRGGIFVWSFKMLLFGTKFSLRPSSIIEPFSDEMV